VVLDLVAGEALLVHKDEPLIRKDEQVSLGGAIERITLARERSLL
jgi:hypothetical protein